MSVIVDSNIILDILTEDKEWYDWSSEQLINLSEDNELIINQVIYSEISIRFSSIEDLDDVISESGFKCENLPWEASFLAGKCFMQYKKNSGAKSSPLPDFYIGAHAAITKRPILTRDKARYKTYFNRLKIISPC
jgi:predicted nucleic acid-binding protein